MRSRYACRLDWLRGIYNRVLLRLPRLPLPGRRALRQVRLKGIPEPFYVRMGTTDWYVFEEMFIDEVYAPALLRGRAGGVRNVVDLGANCGLSVRLWQMAYPSSHIIAVEPDAENLEICRRNASDRNGGRLNLLQACAVGRPRAVSIDRSGGEWEFRMREAEASGEFVEGLTLPSMLERCGMSGTVDLLKSNIEGAEAEVFSDCGAWIGRVRNLVVEVHPPYTREHLTEDLRRAGWSFEIYHSIQGQGGHELLFIQQADGR